MPLLPHFVGPERQWFSGMFLFRKTVVLIINPGWLLSEDRQLWLSSDYGASSVEDHHSQRSDMPNPGSKTDMPAVIELEEATNAEDLPWAEL
jgi:hypothetical protein